MEFNTIEIPKDCLQKSQLRISNKCVSLEIISNNGSIDEVYSTGKDKEIEKAYKILESLLYKNLKIVMSSMQTREHKELVTRTSTLVHGLAFSENSINLTLKNIRKSIKNDKVSGSLIKQELLNIYHYSNIAPGEEAFRLSDSLRSGFYLFDNFNNLNPCIVYIETSDSNFDIKINKIDIPFLHKDDTTLAVWNAIINHRNTTKLSKELVILPTDLAI